LTRCGRSQLTFSASEKTSDTVKDPGASGTGDNKSTQINVFS